MGDIVKEIRSLISDLLSAADMLNKLHRTVNKVHVVGNAASAVGSAAALVGIFAAPFTGGASLAMTIGSLAGGCASGGASIYQESTETIVMRTMFGRVKELVDKTNAPDLMFKYLKLAKSMRGVLKEIKKAYSACRSDSSSKEFKPPDCSSGKTCVPLDWGTTIKVTEKGADLWITVTGREISKVSFSVTGKEAAKVLADASGKEAVKLVEKYTGKVVLEASVKVAGKETAFVSGKVIEKAAQTTRHAKKVKEVSVKSTAKGSQAASTGAKAFNAGTALVSLSLSVYSTAKAADQLLNNRMSKGGAYLRELASLLEESISQQ